MVQEQIQLVGTTPDALVQEILKGVDVRFEALKENFEPKTPTEYLSRRETADLLKIDLSTLHRWTLQGKLQSYGIGNRVYYKRTEIDNALVKLQNS